MQSRKLNENWIDIQSSNWTSPQQFQHFPMNKYNIYCIFCTILVTFFRLFLSDLGHLDCKVLQHCQDPVSNTLCSLDFANTKSFNSVNLFEIRPSRSRRGDEIDQSLLSFLVEDSSKKLFHGRGSPTEFLLANWAVEPKEYYNQNWVNYRLVFWINVLLWVWDWV